MWDLPGPGLEPVSPALAGGFLTTAPPGKPKRGNFDKKSDTRGVLAQRDNYVKRQQEGGHLQAKEEASGETKSATTIIFDFQPLEPRENKFLFKPLRLWHLL